MFLLQHFFLSSSWLKNEKKMFDEENARSVKSMMKQVIGSNPELLKKMKWVA